MDFKRNSQKTYYMIRKVKERKYIILFLFFFYEKKTCGNADELSFTRNSVR